MVEGLGRIGFGLFGLVVLIGIIWLFFNNKCVVDWKLVVIGIILQIVFVVLVILVLGGCDVFDVLGKGFVKVFSFVNEGLGFIFGLLMDIKNYGFIFVFQVLLIIIFFLVLMGVMYYFNVMQVIVWVMVWLIIKVMCVFGVEIISVCVSVFIGQIEVLLIVCLYIVRMIQFELLIMMIGGMVYIVGGVLVVYVGMFGGGDLVQQVFYVKYLLVVSIMVVLVILVVVKLLILEIGILLIRGMVKMEVEKIFSNIIDVVVVGVGDGLKLVLNIGVMLLVFIVLIVLLNVLLIWIGDVIGLVVVIGKLINLLIIFGYVLVLIVWVIGILWVDVIIVGLLIGQKVVINEFVVYIELLQIVNGQVVGVSLFDEGCLIVIYVLCGFVNFSLIVIQIGGIGGLVLECCYDLVKFGLCVVLGGIIVIFMMVIIVGVLMYFS